MTSADGLVTLDNVPGYFSKFSGVKIKTTRPDFSDGLTAVKRKAGSGMTNYENVTLERSFDPEVDDALIAWTEEARCAIEGIDITVRPVRRCKGVEQRGTKAWRLYGCRLESMETMEIDTNDGGNVVKVMLEFTVEQADFR